MIVYFSRSYTFSRKIVYFPPWSRSSRVTPECSLISRHSFLTFQLTNRLKKNSRVLKRVKLIVTSSLIHFRRLHDPIFSQNLKQPPWDELGPMRAKVFHHRNSRMDPSFLAKYHYKYSIYRNSRKKLNQIEHI